MLDTEWELTLKQASATIFAGPVGLDTEWELTLKQASATIFADPVGHNPINK